MARVGGRSATLSWIVGVLCAAVVIGLVWFAMPIMPVMASFVGDSLRSALP